MKIRSLLILCLLTGLTAGCRTAGPTALPTSEPDAPTTILYVRAKSNLGPEALEAKLLERRPKFREVPGLIQKMYGQDPDTGEICGIYFFESPEALAAFRQTPLAKSIPTAYDVSDIRLETYDILYPLHPDRGPAKKH